MAFVSVAAEPYNVGTGTWVKDTVATTWTINTTSTGHRVESRIYGMIQRSTP